MPRLLPRLIQALEKSRAAGLPAFYKVPSPTRKSRTKLANEIPSASANTLLSHRGRIRSILLDDVNPVSHREAFERHKGRAPLLYATQARTPKEGDHEGSNDAERRVMTPEEREWWSSPYLRMLSAPVRQCILTEAYLPSDFMVRVATMRITAPRTGQPALTFFPDGLEHPRFRGRKSGQAHYIVCHKDAVEDLPDRKRLITRFIPRGQLNPNMPRQIGHLLRVRVLQELELLAEELPRNHRLADEYPVIRRLTRAEWKHVQSSGVIPYEGAVALLIVPPLNRNPTTKERPVPSVTASPIQGEDDNSTITRALPVSVLHSVSKDRLNHPGDMPDMLPQAKVPLYNAVSLFPSRPQRAALHLALNRLLHLERRARWRHLQRAKPEAPREETESQGDVRSPKEPVRGDSKASHAYLLYSTSETVLRADTAPLAIALWRLRMWEGEGWNNFENADGIYLNV